MSVKQTSINFYPELSALPVDWLLANIGDKIRVEIDFEVSLYSLASTSNEIILNNNDGYVGDGWAVSTNNAFIGMEVGDTINWGNYITSTLLDTFTIIAKLSDNEVQMDHVFPTVGLNFPSSNSIFSLVKVTTAIKFRYNMIENSEALTFISKVDGSEQMLKHELVDAGDVTVLDMDFVGLKTYQIGSATIEGVSIDTTPYYANRFKLIHYIFVTPFMLADQLTDAINGIAPSYFLNEKCLKYVYNLQALYIYTDPSDYQQITVSTKLGNTGWLNEKFNNIPTNYTVEDVIFRQVPSYVEIEALELTATTQQLTFSIKNIIDFPFINSSSQFVLNFCKAPFDSDEYVGTGRIMKENFIFDRALQTVGDAPVNGDEFGTGYQIITNLEATFVSSSQIDVTCEIEIGADALDRINESELPMYLFFVSVADYALDTDVSDKVSLLVDLDEYFIDTSDPTMIITDGSFLRHYESDPDTEGTTTLDVFPEDEVVNYNRFYIDKNGRLTDEILLKSIQLKVIAKNSSTLEEFTLDNQSFDLSGSLLVSGVQYVNIALNRVFHIPATEIRKQIKVTRRADLDAGNKYYYEVYFPFLVRWEYFIKLAAVNSDFFDILEPNDGLNNFWDRFAHLTDWGLYYQMRILATKNDELQSYVTEQQFTSNDWDSNASWTPTSIKAYDIDTNDELFDAVANKKYIYGYKNTLIVALFTNITPPIDIDEYVVNFGIESFEGTGVAERRRMSSIWASDADTWFKSIDASSKTVLTLVGVDTVKAEVWVDFSKIPDKPIFKIAARLYDLNVTPITTNKRMEDGTFKKMQDGTQKVMD